MNNYKYSVSFARPIEGSRYGEKEFSEFRHGEFAAETNDEASNYLRKAVLPQLSKEAQKEGWVIRASLNLWNISYNIGGQTSQVVIHDSCAAPL